MRKIIFSILLICICISTQAQLYSVVTSKESEAMGKYTSFVIVDVVSQFVLAKNPQKYDPSGDMPTCYFTSVLGSLTGLTYGDEYRNLVINNRFGADNECWAVAENQENHETLFSRRKFMADFKGQYCWIPYIDGDYVVFLNLKGATDKNLGGYLSITEDGVLKSVKTFAEASRFKLIKE